MGWVITVVGEDTTMGEGDTITGEGSTTITITGEGSTTGAIAVATGVVRGGGGGATGGGGPPTMQEEARIPTGTDDTTAVDPSGDSGCV